MQHRVVWSQGMFLQPQHFQQETRFLEHLLGARIGASFPYAWGFSELVLDESQLASGQLALSRAQGVLPDGSAFSVPDADPLPPPLAVPADMREELVVLAVARSRPGVSEFDYGDGNGDVHSRYRVMDKELRDQTRAADEPEPVQLGMLRLALMRERDLADGHVALGVARVLERRADGQVVIDRGYIAPQTRIDASGQLSATASFLHGLVRQRAQVLAAGMGQLGNQVSEVADFVQLQFLNRVEPQLHQYASAPSVHPWFFHLACVALAGELATFSRAQRLPPAYPSYRHDALQQVFEPVLRDIRDAMSREVQRHAVAIELVDRSHGVRTAVVHDAELLRSAGFVLAVRAQLPTEQLRQRFPAQSKIGPVDRIKDLVNLHLPGIALRGLAVAPRQLPYHAGSHYFELERQGELWKQFERTGSLALHVAGDFPALELELWALRQA